MSFLGGAYADSDSGSDEEPPKPAPAPASSSKAAPKRKNKRKVFDLSKLPVKRRPVVDDSAGGQEEEEDLGKAPSKKKAIAKKSAAAAAASSAQDGSMLGSLPMPAASSSSAAAASSSGFGGGGMKVPKPSEVRAEREAEAKKKEPEMITSLDQLGGYEDDDDDDESAAQLFSVEPAFEPEEAADESESPEEDGVEGAGPVMPSDWDSEEIGKQYDMPEEFAGLGKDTLLSEQEKRALSMGANIQEINPADLRDNDWRRKQLAAELPGRPTHEKRVIKTNQYSVEDQGRVVEGVTMNQKRKHQIGWLAQTYADASYDLAQREMDGAGKKRSTHQKYGW